MIMLATTQELRLAAPPDALFAELVDDALDQILNHFLDEAAAAVFEVLGAEHERLDTDDGRRITPGHALESAAFVMHEAIARDDQSLIRPALKMIDYSMARGWDEEYGGLLYFVDVAGKPPTRLEWDMKLWWPHAEALYALLLAYHLSRETISTRAGSSKCTTGPFDTFPIRNSVVGTATCAVTAACLRHSRAACGKASSIRRARFGSA